MISSMIVKTGFQKITSIDPRNPGILPGIDEYKYNGTDSLRSEHSNTWNGKLQSKIFTAIKMAYLKKILP